MLALTLLSAFSVALAAPLLGLGPQDKPPSGPYPAFNFTENPPWTYTPDVYAKSLSCPLGLPSAASPPVLLVHGTMASGNETWNQSYVPALKADGFTACYIELPFRGGIDMQEAAEYIAYNLHYMSYLAGGVKTAVITHSQGGPDAQWALAWFTSTQAVTSMYLPLVPDLLGVTYASFEFNTICPAYMCQPSIWQQMIGSRFTQALRAHNFQALVPSTLVWTPADEIVTPPNTNALLPGGTTLSVVDVCPGHVIDHIYIINDAPAYAIMQDALHNGGTASLGRIVKNNPNVCTMPYAKNMSPTAVNGLAYVVDGALQGFVLGTNRVPSEPALKPYVYGGNANSV